MGFVCQIWLDFYTSPRMPPSMSLEKIRKATNRYIVVNLLVIAFGVVLAAGELFYLSGDYTPIFAAGIAIASGGFVRLFDYRKFKLEEHKDLVNELVEEWGVLDIQGGRGRAEKERYEDLLLRCEDKLHIQAISLSRFQSDLGHRVDRLGGLDVEIRLLLLDPESEICEWYGEADTERGDLQSTIRQSTERFMQREIDSLEIRYYNALPANYFRVDSKAFVGPYFMDEPSRSTLTFFGNTDGDLVKSYTQNFEALWEESRVPHEGDYET
jgi:hypothetical protein